MKTAVIYCSQTGFTERYAHWIAQAAGGDCLPLAQAKKADLSGYDAIVYGGWACAGGISKLNWFKANMGRWADKKRAVFCVGGSPADSPDIAPALEKSFPEAKREHIPVFYCPGGFNYEKMSAPSKLMMKAFVATLRAKRDKTPDEEVMVKMITSSYDISDKAYIEPILRYLEA